MKKIDFQEELSTEKGVVKLSDRIHDGSEKNKQAILFKCFIDLSKAFDTVGHEILITKSELWIWWKQHKLIWKFSEKLISVLYNDNRFSEIFYGDPQGFILRLLMFSIYVSALMKLQIPSILYLQTMQI